MAVKIKHSSSRRILLKDGKVVKFYPRLYGYFLHEVFRIMFQIANGVYRIDFISRKRRITNEAYAREVMANMGMDTTRITRPSFDGYFLEEIFEADSQGLGDLEKTDPLLASRHSRYIGEMTRALNDRGYYFIDNRSSNWLIKEKDSMKRTDMELFRHEESYRDFYSKCDYLSFVSSVESETVREEFIRGYGKKMRYSPLTGFLARLYIRLADAIF